MTGALAFTEAGLEVPARMERTAARAHSPEPIDARLVRRAVNGDRAAFAHLVDLHKRPVYGLCLRLLNHPEEARDAAQETFARAWAALATYDTGQPFPPWLLRIARNHCIDLVRQRLPAGRQLPLDAAPADGEAPPLELADTALPPADEALERVEQGAAVARAVATLPSNQREAIHLFHVEGMSYKEIAGSMEVPIGTVMTWLHRARKKLREVLVQKESP